MGVAVRVEIAWLQGVGGDSLFELSYLQGALCHQKISAGGFFAQNILGCFIFAIVAQRKDAIGEVFSVGLSTGFCGSLTTFATWMQYSAVMILIGRARTSAYFLVALHCSCLCAHQLGCKLAAPEEVHVHAKIADESADNDDEEETDSDSTDDPTKACGIGRVVTVVAVFFLLLFLGHKAMQSDMTAVATILLAPCGAWLRYMLSFGNARCQRFPWFTLLANALGCAADVVMDSMLYNYSGARIHMVAKALGGGFGGSLSTVSSFIGELRSTKPGILQDRAIYAVGSYAVGLAILMPFNALYECPP